MKEKLKILICDDHAILLEGLKACLQRMPFIGSVIVSNNPTDALNLLKEQSSNIDLCITDLDFAQEASGLMLIDHIHEHACHIRIWCTLRTKRYGISMQSCILAQTVWYLRVARPMNCNMRFVASTMAINISANVSNN